MSKNLSRNPSNDTSNFKLNCFSNQKINFSEFIFINSDDEGDILFEVKIFPILIYLIILII